MSYKHKSVFATLPKTTRGVPLVLGGDPKGKNFLYVSGNSVIIRDIDEPLNADIYTQHSVQTTCAKYSPSGFYIASGDVNGKIRIWDTTQVEHILKNEYQPLGGTIRDISWSPDSQRMVVCGDGRESYARVFLAETGSSVGEIMGHAKLINSVDYRSVRPFRIATASEDNEVNLYEGPPFKFLLSKKEHTRFANAVRFSPDGLHFATASADGKCFVYDGKTGDLRAQMGEPAHSGGIYALAWSPDNSEIMTVSGDRSARVWAVATGAMVGECVFGSTVDDMQVGCLWQGAHLLSVSLSGVINYLERGNLSTPSRVVKGHNKPISCVTASDDRRTIVTGSQTGALVCWDAASGRAQPLIGRSHANQVLAVVVDGDDIVSCSMDDCVRVSYLASGEWGTHDVRMESMPRDIAVHHGLLAVACMNEVTLLRGDRISSLLKVDYEPSSVTYNDAESHLAVGGGLDHRVHVYRLQAGDQLAPMEELQHAGGITAVAYSPGNACLGAADANRRVIVYSVPGYQRLHNVDWSTHSARVTCIAWSPNSLFLASGGVDTNVIVWSVREPNKWVEIRSAHPMSPITGLAWLSDAELVSVGSDSNVHTWQLSQ
ncbi:PREDICTED: actin-interacting protein 1-like [Priapulus caudatus]|uniref:Actin-interacting protein 1-like n=1 Tax=Priapulus caudatus TaxID=37621 RepID=A0ABM1DR98_PRICU|nr:PREDICTED: actin-interacting protein 1-like [Priapulus caudatus]